MLHKLPRMHFSLQQSSTPTVRVVSVAEAKDHMRITSTDDDTYISGLIQTGTRYVENQAKRQLITATWKMRFADFPYYYGWAFPWGSLQSVSSIEYFDENGTSQTLASTKYWVDPYSTLGSISLRTGESWPQVQDDRPDAVVATWICGYSSGSTGVPETARDAVNLMCGNRYENREPIVIGAIPKDLELSVESMISTIKIEGLR